ncbi:GILT-like protein 3 [Melanaphis sacchari]|uniref:GILT-like protein 3 n=1 Tax=Melanaphis sacchari TaxID=742174 RepID=UPI000DC130F6|nr:GILT-like protein 3 [Melanaphis sacchari]
MNMKTCFAFLVCAMGIAVMNATTDVPIPQQTKLDLSIYYSARSTESIKFILTKLKPLYCKIQKYVNLNLVPFGKGYSTNMGFFCQNGRIECLANTVHNCVLSKLSGNTTAYMEYLSCALEHVDNTIHVEEMCAGRIGLIIDEIKSCVTSREGYLLMLEAEIGTKDQTHGPRFVPSFVFDEFYNDRDQRLASTDFEATLCGKLIDKHGFTNVCNNINNVLRMNEVC